MDNPVLGRSGASLTVTSFVSASHPTESCGVNGLPLTPHSISILGAAQLLLTCHHPNLGNYLDIQRGKHQRIIFVVETWSKSLRNVGMADMSEERLLDVAREILLASAYLNQMNMINMNISRDNVMLTDDGDVKLSNYGLGRMTNYGAWVDFPVGDPRMTAPEILRQPRNNEVDKNILSESGDLSITTIPAEPGVPYPANVDTWSLGMLLASLCLDLPVLWPGTKVEYFSPKVVQIFLLNFNQGPPVGQEGCQPRGVRGRGCCTGEGGQRARMCWASGHYPSGSQYFQSLSDSRVSVVRSFVILV